MAEPGIEDSLRYSRHLVMPEVGVEGQRRLRESRVLCVGAGGLGSPAALYLAAAGVGTLGIVEADVVDLSNIQRQVLYATADVGRAKLEAATERLAALNPGTEVVPHPVRLQAENAMEIVAQYDVVVDGSDNFPTRYLVNDACVLAGKPDVHASVFRFEGQLAVFDASRGPCYRCLFPEPPPPELVPSCAEGGVLGALPGILGSLQALETIKLLLGKGDPLVGRLLLFDGLGMSFRELPVSRDPDCPACGERPTITAPVDYEIFCSSWAGEPVQTMTPEQLAQRLDSGHDAQLLDVREPPEHAIASIDGFLLIPLGELEQRLGELDRQRECVVTCHRGGRSAQACALLRAAGFSRVVSLEGGIDAWAQRVEPGMARY